MEGRSWCNYWLSWLQTLTLISWLSWLQTLIQQSFRTLMVWIIRAGPIPTHIAIIMDGNRRFAQRHRMEKRSGHEFGAESLMKTLKHCYELGVQCVTIYAFSIENFKRSKSEVDALMDLMHQKLEAILEKDHVLNQHGIRVRVIGNLELLPERVRKTAQKVMVRTMLNGRATLNVCVAYTSTAEIVHAVQGACLGFLGFGEEEREKEGFLGFGPGFEEGKDKGFLGFGPGFEEGKDKGFLGFGKGFEEEREKGFLGFGQGFQEEREKGLLGFGQGFEEEREEEGFLGCGRGFEEERGKEGRDLLSVEDIEGYLYTAGFPEPDLLIRTSGETRLSNFLLWQSGFCYLHACGVLWPEFSFMHLFKAVLCYQRAYPHINLSRRLRDLKACNQNPNS